MRSEEVVMGHEERGECDGAIGCFKTVGCSDVVFVGSIEAFDDLFEMAVEFGLFIKIL